MIDKKKYKTKDDREFVIRANELDKVKIACKCGHKTVVPVWVDKQICSWCGHYVYRNKQVEFKDKLKQRLKEV